MHMTAHRITIFAAVLLMTVPALAAERYFSLFGGVYAPAGTSATDKAFKAVDVDYTRAHYGLDYPCGGLKQTRPAICC